MATRPDRTELDDAVLQTVDELAAELHPGWQPHALTPESNLERDLGLDSLGRVELMLRLQRRFEVRLSDEVAITARTVADLVGAIAHASGEGEHGAWLPAPPAPPQAGAPLDPPASAGTLIDVLDYYAECAPERVHLNLSELEGAERTLSYGDLRSNAARVGGGLRARGLNPGDTVALMLPSGTDFFFAFHGILRAGGVPIPLYPPVRAEHIEDHCRRLAGILCNARARYFIASESTRMAARILRGLVPDLVHVTTVPELCRNDEPADSVPQKPGDLALLQYTSGTTGDPKGVTLTHANLLANIRAMGAAAQASPDDVFVSWLPLYHDMGLIGAALATLYFNVRVVLLSPLQFMARPQQWLWTIHRHGGTLAAGPSFAYDLCSARIEDADIEGLDLSTWRIAFNGAEMVSARAARRFCDRFGPYGFASGAMTPVYGLAESSVGLVFPPLGRGLHVDRVQREAFRANRYAEPAALDAPSPLEFVGCGHVLPGHELRIVDSAGNPLPDRTEGRLEFRGPSCTTGYFRNEAATRSLFDDGWLDSGDLAYLDEGEVFLTGRVKELIIRAGRNIYPQEIEQAACDVPGIRKNNVAAFATVPRAGERERLVVVAETRATDREELRRLRNAVAATTLHVLDAAPDEVVLVPPRTIPKTSSGKIRRTATRRLYDDGGLIPRRGAGAQLLRLSAAGFGPRLRRWIRSLGQQTFVLRAWIAAVIIGVPTTVLLFLLPGRVARAQLMRQAVRITMHLTGIPLRMTGAYPADDTPRVVVANHTSYLDALIMRAVLPGPALFVAKRELASRRIARLLFKRVGVEYVDRQDHRQGLADLQHVRERAEAGQTLVAFAEGALAKGPGLRRFRAGPFMVAVQAHLPIVPVAIRGARSILRGFSLSPRPGRVDVTIGDPITPTGSDWNAAMRLRDRTRTFILQHCGEPDLAGESQGVIDNL